MPAKSVATAIFESLELEWQALARTPGALAQWAQCADAEPMLQAGSAAEILGAVAWSGYRVLPAGAVVLSALLRQSANPIAARALLQALLPRISAERIQTPTYGHGVGENWLRPADSLADLVAECYAAIKRHAGEDRQDVDRLIVCEGARRLRTARQAQRRYHARHPALLDAHASGAVQPLTGALSDAERLAGALVEAVRAGSLGRGQARLLYATRVQGLAASEVARREGLASGAVYYALARAERALVATMSAPALCKRSEAGATARAAHSSQSQAGTRRSAA